MKRICLNRAVLDFMDARIDQTSSVLEYGAGWSSRWFADRCGSLHSIETNAEWAEKVRIEISDAMSNVRITLTDKPASVPASLADLVLVDSDENYREACARSGWNSLKHGGWLIFDDAQRPRHATAIEWLTDQGGEPRRLEWAQGDIETATERLALAWQKL